MCPSRTAFVGFIAHLPDEFEYQGDLCRLPMKHLSLKLVVDPVPESTHVDVFLCTVSAGENTSAGLCSNRWPWNQALSVDATPRLSILRLHVGQLNCQKEACLRVNSMGSISAMCYLKRQER